MRIKEVNSSEDIKAFHKLPFVINANDPNWIAPLTQDVEKVFDPTKNPYFAHGECQRWLLTDDSGKVIGRIAAFINKTNAYTEDQPTGGCGFFECIQDKDAAFLLFDTAKNWLQERGMEAMDGPVNFGERNAWWGLLVEGFTEPTYLMNYNPPYYEEFFDAYGFKDYFRQLSFGLPVDMARPEKYNTFYERLLKQGYRFEHANKDNLEKAAEDFRIIYNQGWQNFHNFHEMTKEQSLNLLNSMKPVMIDYLLWFGYYNDEPVAMFIMLPELNQWFKHVHGNFNLWGKLKFLFYKIFGHNEKIFGTVFGVVPAHQRKGVEAGIVMAADKVVRPKNKWKWIELTWIADFNPKMVHTCETIGGKIVKQHVTYRKLFDPKKPFYRHPIVE
jgi:hypothetical protein